MMVGNQRALYGQPGTEVPTGRPLSVLVLAPDPRLSGGVGQFLRSALAHLSDATTARLLIIGRRPSDRARLRMVLRPLADCLRLLWTAWTTPSEVLHANPSMAPKAILRDGLFLAAARLGRFRAVVVFFHGWEVPLADAIGRSPWRRALFRFAYGGADHVFVLSTAFREQLVALGMDRDRVEVTTTMFNGAELGDRAVSLAGRRVSRPARLLFMGRMVAAKGVHELLDAFVLLRRSFPGLELIVGGDGPLLEEIRARVQRLGLQGAVHCPGFVSGSTKACLFAESDIFVLPTSHPEGCPVAILEAMAMGLPVVASRVGGIPLVVEDGRNGRLIARVGPESIRTVLEELLNDRAALRQMGARNREKAWRLYEAKAITRSLEARYRQLVS